MFNQEQILDIIKQYNGGAGTTTIGPQYGVTHKTICKLLKKNGINIKNKFYGRITDEQADDIVGLYETGEYTMNALSKEFNINHATISYYLRKAGLVGKSIIQHYDCNTDYFEKIDTEEKAYWLGFLYADGNVYITKNGGSVYIRIELSSLDEDLLKLFLFSIGSNHPIKYRSDNTKVRVCIGSIKMGTDLYNLGCPPHKTYSIEWPSDKIVPQHLKRHFLRGYSDGDGTFYTYKKNPESGIVFGLCASYRFCEGVRKWLKEQCDCGMVKIKMRRNIFHIKYSGRCQISRVWHLFYDNATIHLLRKKEAVKQYIYPSSWCGVSDGRKFNPRTHYKGMVGEIL
jgi:hypothetical protein